MQPSNRGSNVPYLFCRIMLIETNVAKININKCCGEKKLSDSASLKKTYTSTGLCLDRFFKI